MSPEETADRQRKFLSVQLLTIVRIPLGAFFAAVVLLPSRSLTTLAAALTILLVIELTDFFDGILARRFGIVTEWGAMLDPYADSMARLIVYWTLAAAGHLLLLVPLIMALRDVTVAYSRIVLTKHGKSVSARLSGKIKAVVQCFGAFAALLATLLPASPSEVAMLVISWTVIAVTFASVFQYARSALAAAAGAEKP